MKKRFTEEQIIGFLKEAEADVSIKELGALPPAACARQLADKALTMPGRL